MKFAKQVRISAANDRAAVMAAIIVFVARRRCQWGPNGIRIRTGDAPEVHRGHPRNAPEMHQGRTEDAFC